MTRNIKRPRCALVIIFALLLTTGLACAPEEDSAKEEPAKDEAAKEVPGKTSGTLGKVDFPVSCTPAERSNFEHALALLHNMMYSQAGKEFSAIAAREPGCAMAHWGVAMTYLRPLWRATGEEDLKKGSAALEKAREELKPSTERERAYIDALRAFYKDYKTVDHRRRLVAWEGAMEKLHNAYPGDIDAGAFYALSHLATAPKGDKTFSHQKRAGALMEKLLARAPEHPGLHHYTIHAYDNPLLARRAVEVARAYYNLAPDVPHALHMPTHIFVRLGLWEDVIDWNLRSAAAAIRQSTPDATSLHYAHAMDYLMYAYLQLGRDDLAEETLGEINSVRDYEDSFASAYGIAAARARYPLERRKWSDAARIELRTHASFPWDKYPWHESTTYFARGIGAARSGDAKGARKAQEKLDGFYNRTVDAGKKYWAVVVDAQRTTVEAWAAFAEGDREGALKTMLKGADLEDSVDKHPVTPGAVLPARELLGDMLLMLDRPVEALEAYEVSLNTSPNRLNSLYGAARAARLAGDKEKARSYFSRLVSLAGDSGAERPAVKEAKQFLEEDL